MVVNWIEKKEERRAGPVPIFRQTLCQLSGAKGCDEQIKQFWRGNCSAPNQIYLRSPLRRTDVLSAKDFNSLHWDADKQPDGALQSLHFLFNCVFFPVDLFLANPRPSWRKSQFSLPRLPLPPLVMAVKQPDVLLHHTDEWLESGAQTEMKLSPLLLPDAVFSFVCKRNATILTEEVPALGNRSQCFVVSCACTAF